MTHVFVDLQSYDLPIEMLELLLLKTSFIWTLRLWKTTPNPDAEIFCNLATVCSKWLRAMTNRSWFRRTLTSRLSGGNYT